MVTGEGDGRRVRLILLEDGVILGVLPTFGVATPWWQEVSEVVRVARRRWDVDIVILRLVATTLEPGGSRGAGGEVTYLAEALTPLPLAARAALVAKSVPGDVLADHPLRMSWARPGGPAEVLRWADLALERAGRRRIAEPCQEKTWNLSAIWRLETSAGVVWLKVVPPFLGHEPAVIAAVGAVLPDPVAPRLLAHDGPRMLLDDATGEDQYDAPLALRLRMVTLLVELQIAWAAQHANPVSPAAIPSWGEREIAGWGEVALAASAQELTGDERQQLENLIGGLHQRFEELAACGIPETLVHGDYHSGNVRYDGDRLTILDWGDSGIGHPLLDLDGLVSRTQSDWRCEITRHWINTWRNLIPSSEPERAAELLKPIAPLRSAGVYQRFVEGIEPSERPYHASDVADQLRRAIHSARGSCV